MKKLALLIAVTALTISESATSSVQEPALDTTIRVLIVKEGTASQSFIDASVSYLQGAWPTVTGAGPGSSISITVVNPGVAIPIHLSSSDNVTTLVNELKLYATTNVPLNASAA